MKTVLLVDDEELILSFLKYTSRAAISRCPWPKSIPRPYPTRYGNADNARLGHRP